jgi:uncharacterized protein (TIGR02444 family)
MRDSARPLDEDSWEFAVQLYTEPGVADACLRLQAEAGVDVMLLLCIAFACAKRGLLLNASDILDLDALCRPWREQVVQPLRSLRTALKSGPPPAPGATTEPLRSRVRASELMAERLQNDLLARRLRMSMAGSTTGTATGLMTGQATAASALTREDIRVVLGHVVSLALRQRGGGSVAEVSPAIDLIVAAAISV